MLKRKMALKTYKKAARYAVGLIGLWIIVMSTAACKGNIQLEDRNYVMALGLDAETGSDGETYLRASLSFPDLEALIGKGGNIHYPVMTIRGNNLEEIHSIYENESNKRLDYGQLQVIVFGRELLENSPMMEQVLAYIKNRQQFTRTILVCRAENTAEEIISLDETVNGSIGLYIKEMFENNAAEAGYEKSTINDMIIAWKNRSETVELALLKAVDGKIPKICGVSEYKPGEV